VLYTANGAAFNVISLTDAQDDCQGAARVAYLTLWGAASLKGCWLREQGEVVGRFPGLEERIPVGEFQPTEAAEHRGASL